MRHISTLATLLTLLASASCAAGGPDLEEVTRFRDMWESRHLTRYSYETTTTGFFNALSGRTIRLVVLGDTVRSAVFAATGDTVPVPPTQFATIDELFAGAIAAVGSGTLTDIQVDRELSYPRRLDFSGPPDASGSVFASDLQPLP